MCVLEGLAGLIEDVEGQLIRQIALSADQLLEGKPVYVFEHDVVAPPLLEVVVDIDDVVVAKIHEQAGLAAESLDEVGIAPEGQFLEDDGPLECGVDAFVHRPHPTLGEELADLVLTDAFRCLCHTAPSPLFSPFPSDIRLRYQPLRFRPPALRSVHRFSAPAYRFSRACMPASLFSGITTISLSGSGVLPGWRTATLYVPGLCSCTYLSRARN